MTLKEIEEIIRVLGKLPAVVAIISVTLTILALIKAYLDFQSCQALEPLSQEYTTCFSQSLQSAIMLWVNSIIFPIRLTQGAASMGGFIGFILILVIIWLFYGSDLGR